MGRNNGDPQTQITKSKGIKVNSKGLSENSKKFVPSEARYFILGQILKLEKEGGGSHV